MSNIIVGLDIGTTKIACFIGQKTENDKIKILGYGKTESVGVERGVVRNISLTAASIRKAVDDAAGQANVEVEDVYVGIAGQHIKSIQNQGNIVIPNEHRLITQEDVDNLIEQQNHILMQPGEEIIHIFPQSFSVDNEELPPEVSPVGVAGKSLKANFHIITGNTNNILNIKYSVEDAGLKIKDIVLEPIASSFAVLNNIDKDAGVALVDIGGGTTDVAIFSQGIIRHTSVLPLAGNSITEDIRKGCSILKGQAESLKTKFGSCLPSNMSQDDIVTIPGIRNQPSREISMKTLAGIIKARMQVILEQVDYEIGLSGYNNKTLLAGIVLTGGGARMKHIRELSELITKTNTRIGIPNEHLEDAPEEVSHPMYATAIGLVIYGINHEEELEHHATSNEGQTNTASKDNNSFDIFAGMGTTTQQTTTPPSSGTYDTGLGNDLGTTDKDSKGFFKSVTNYFKRVLTENVDDE